MLLEMLKGIIKPSLCLGKPVPCPRLGSISEPGTEAAAIFISSIISIADTILSWSRVLLLLLLLVFAFSSSLWPFHSAVSAHMHAELKDGAQSPV